MYIYPTFSFPISLSLSLSLSNQKLDDAAAELMMVSDGKVMLLIGEAFIETSEDDANECKCTIIKHVPLTNNIRCISFSHSLSLSQIVKRNRQYYQRELPA
jgi:hypothetical protein